MGRQSDNSIRKGVLAERTLLLKTNFSPRAFVHYSPNSVRSTGTKRSPSTSELNRSILEQYLLKTRSAPNPRPLEPPTCTTSSLTQLQQLLVRKQAILRAMQRTSVCDE